MSSDQSNQMNYTMARTTQSRFGNNPPIKQKGTINHNDKVKG